MDDGFDDDFPPDFARDDYDDQRADAFRCPGCEANTGSGRLCGACRDEEDKRAGVRA
jgi:hypothetical protein